VPSCPRQPPEPAAGSGCRGPNWPFRIRFDHLIVPARGRDRALHLEGMGLTARPKKEPQVVLNLGDRADGGGGVVAWSDFLSIENRRLRSP